MAKIRGFAIRGALKFIKHRQYAGGIREILAQLSDDTAPIFENKIAYAAWYPYSAYDELLSLIDANVGDGVKHMRFIEAAVESANNGSQPVTM